jgi:pyridoxamine 5'-phosphate oxidase
MTNDPHRLFDIWFEEARQSEPNDPDAMALATTDMTGQPSVRMVLMKSHDARGFTFHTNVESRKGGEIAANPNAAVVFHWKSIRRQVRAEGRIERVSDAEADAYFATRSRGSQIGAWASSQSRPLESAEALAARHAEMERRFEGGDVPRPPYWTGLRLVPHRIEFWSNRPFRLHERRLFMRTDEGWSESLLYP